MDKLFAFKNFIGFGGSKIKITNPKNFPLSNKIANIYKNNELIDSITLNNAGEGEYLTDECGELIIKVDKYKSKININAYGTYEAKLTDVVNYGLKINKVDSKCSYVDDAEGMRSAKVNLTNGAFDYGDWKDAFFMPKPCMLKKDGTVDYYLNPNDYNKKVDGTQNTQINNLLYDGNVMIEFPKIYYKITNDYENNFVKISISNEKLDEKFRCWSCIDDNDKEIDHFYISAYEAYSDGTSLRSISGQVPIYSYTNQYETLAQANGEGYHMGVWADRLLINLLLLLIGKSVDCQTVFGTGYCSYSAWSAANVRPTGSLNNVGLFYGTSSNFNGVKVFGMEHWWGGLWDAVAGYVINNYDVYTKMTYGMADGSPTIGYGNGSGATAYTSHIKMNYYYTLAAKSFISYDLKEFTDRGCFYTRAGAQERVQLGDVFYHGNASSYTATPTCVTCGGGFYTGSNGWGTAADQGPFAMNVFNVPTYITTRLSYKG